MRKKIVVSSALLLLLTVGIMATTVLASDLNLSNNLNDQKVSLDNVKLLTTESVSSVRELVPENEIGRPTEVNDQSLLEDSELDRLMQIVPETYEEVEAEVIPNPRRTRFLLYTFNGEHIMWGYVGNGRFFGQDNLDKRCWGIYGKNFFAGFYDGEIFWGRYQNGQWKAVYLFGEKYAHGEYIIFPLMNLESLSSAVEP
jgi:hypothetical protein